MISIIFALLIIALCGVLFFLAKFHPIPAVAKMLRAGLLTTCIVSLVIGLALYPKAVVWQAELSADAEAKALEAEAARAREMIVQLGSAAAYIEYLKATRKD